MESTTIFPLDCLKSDQCYHVSVNRDYTGQYVISGQLTKEQYLSLDGMKVKTSDGKTITGKRWTKVISVESYNGLVWEDGNDIQLDRIYISASYSGKYGYTKSQLGYVEVSQDSGMPKDDTGHKGCTVFHIQPTSEEICNTIQSYIQKG